MNGHAVLGAWLGGLMVLTTACVGSSEAIGFGDEGISEDGSEPGSSSGSSSGTSSSSSGHSGPGWPGCVERPGDALATTLPQIWYDNPVEPTAVWLEGVYVSAISGGGCQLNTPCHLFVQQHPSYGMLHEAAWQSLRLEVSDGIAHYFEDINVGDQIDLAAHAWRRADGGRNELQLQVSSGLPGCAVVVGRAELAPVAATLGDLTVDAYEESLGPVLVQVAAVVGEPEGLDETFALWPQGDFDDDSADVTSLSPYFLPNHQFVGLAAGQVFSFWSVTGVFAVYSPASNPSVKYEEIYLRSMADLLLGE
ncbi:MAG: hypothetical protein JRI68_17110 [Deltaproteobacteria bacterium]|nr:hypothetical protein [Deltaproteobacteria bacterium]